MGLEAPRVVLVETSEALPGLLPFQAWDAMATAESVYLRDPDSHPSAEHLWFAGMDLQRLEPAELDRRRVDLGSPGSPQDRRLAKALLEQAADQGKVVYLLGPEDEQLTQVVGMESADHPAEVEMVFFAQVPRGTELLRLVEVMSRLRDPEAGCPWDLEQDHETLTGYLLEECYELIEAIEDGGDDAIREELGDVLLQVVFHAQIAVDRRAFGIDDVARGIADKLVRRHPHVFADVDVADADEVSANWDRLKAEEKGRSGPFEGVPRNLPALMLAATLQRKAAKHDWEEPEEPVERVRERLAAVRSAEGRSEDLETELGELLGAVVALSRTLDLDPERALRRHAERFRREWEGGKPAGD